MLNNRGAFAPFFIEQQIFRGIEMNQTNQILTHLMRDEPITPMDALKLYGCFRLAARINDLREMGYMVVTNIKKRNGKRYAEYSLPVKKRQAVEPQQYFLYESDRGMS